MIALTIALVVFLFPLAYSPGPGNMFFAANGARFGVSATLPANTGYHVATWIITIFIGYGFAAAIENSPAIFVLIKYAGSAYVLYLAWKIFRSGVITTKEDPLPAGFFDGVVLLLLNPKAYIIITLMFTQFLTNTSVNHNTAVLWISTVFTLNNFIAFFIWTAIGDQIAARFRDEYYARKLNMIFGSVLAIVALWMLAS